MSKDVYICGLGTVSALGCGIDTLRDGLESKINPKISEEKVQGADGDVLLKVYTAEVNGLDRFVSRASLRRIDRFNKMALMASFLALEDSGIAIKDRTRVGIVFGSGYGPLSTTFGFMDSLINFGDKCASPTLFANSVHNALASQVSISMKIEGPSLTVTCFEDTFSAVLRTASAWIRDGVLDYVIAGAGEEYCPVRGYASALLGAGHGEAASPFSFTDCAYMPGEGFSVFLLGASPAEKNYCRVATVSTGAAGGEGVKENDVVFLAANGARGTGRYYKRLAEKVSVVRAYSNLYGGMSVGNAFDAAIAALCLKEGKLYGDAMSDLEELGAGSRIECVEYGNGGNFSRIDLMK
jgi:3-oxoacyl-[acyl-carrier-protein] synthase II